ncbi:E3 ubiquitin-protein ligase ubr2 [Cichlidogyrus casuarinus]|uniref:E3 ubiquitin-protein ligase n=1 Tax=Cichlidogyrus casuarinus TaxID=1844966 RepID=A0ABD2QN70_9PLAT
MQSNCFIFYMMQQYNVLWKAVRKEGIGLIIGLILKDLYYRYCFSYQYIKHYTTIIQSSIYDDHLEYDTLTQVACQILTVISIARWLLEEADGLYALLYSIHRSIVVNSQPTALALELPNYTNLLTEADREPYPSETLSKESLKAITDLVKAKRGKNAVTIQILRLLNEHYWTLTEKANTENTEECLPVIVFSWQPGVNLQRTYFNPFERLFNSLHSVDYALGSLTNVRPLKGDGGPDEPGWWTQASRDNFLNYYDQLLDLLAHMQDAKAIQRVTKNHIEMELEWTPDYFLLHAMVNWLGLTVQVASSDPELYLRCLQKLRTLYMRRVGVYDRRFRLAPLGQPQPISISELSAELLNDAFAFQCFGCSAEVYSYDIARFKV